MLMAIGISSSTANCGRTGGKLKEQGASQSAGSGADNRVKDNDETAGLRRYAGFLLSLSRKAARRRD